VILRDLSVMSGLPDDVASPFGTASGRCRIGLANFCAASIMTDQRRFSPRIELGFTRRSRLGTPRPICSPKIVEVTARMPIDPMHGRNASAPLMSNGNPCL
jgi:hypothetical protein